MLLPCEIAYLLPSQRPAGYQTRLLIVRSQWSYLEGTDMFDTNWCQNHSNRFGRRVIPTIAHSLISR